MAKKPESAKYVGLNVKIPTAIYEALVVGMLADKAENLSASVRGVLADGMKHRMLTDGIDPAFLNLPPEQMAAYYIGFLDARLDRLGKPGMDGEPSRFYLAKPPAGGMWERRGVRLYGVLEKGLCFTPDDATLIGPVLTLADMLRDLRSPDLMTRASAGMAMATSIGAGMRISGMSHEDAEQGVGKDLSDLLGKAMAGESAAADELERVLTNDPSKAPPPPIETPTGTTVEPSAAERALAARHTPTDLLDKLALRSVPAKRRRELLGAFYLAVGNDLADRQSRANAESLFAIADRLLAGDQDAIEEARHWITVNLIVREPA